MSSGEKNSVKWTDEQRQAFDDRNHNLLVSASAGSGKTTVMIKRIVDLVINEKTPISNFLVVTFTKASASDMKKKLVDELVKHHDDIFAISQIEEVETSDISNLHSFCSRLITSYFYEVGVDPSYHIIDDIEGGFIRDRALEKLFENKQKQNDKEFFELFEIFQNKRSDKNLKELIKSFNNYLNSHLDGEAWFKNNLQNTHQEDLNSNSCASLINHYATNLIKEYQKKIDLIEQECLNFGQQKLYDHFVELSSKIGVIKPKNSFLINAKNLFEITFNTKPAPDKKLEGYEYINQKAQMLNDDVKDGVSNLRENFVSADENILLQGINFAKNKLIALYNLTMQFNEIYSALKKEICGLDFNDLERFALKILSNPNILQSVKSKYKYVFVDEYQDINNVQEKIISLVSSENNRFMVGDVKQSIYRFRLCDPDIFLQKYEEYGQQNPNSKLIKLNCNFRSDKKILKFVDQVFSGVMTEDFGGVNYENDAKFTPGEKNLDNDGSVNLCFIDTQMPKIKKAVATGVYSVKKHEQEESTEVKSAIAEARFVASKIAELVRKDNPERIEYSDIAILVGSRNQATAKFVEVLKSFEIPVSSDEKYDLMSRRYIDELVSFVKLLCNAQNDIELFKVLKSRLFGFSDEEIIEIRKLDMRKNFYECLELTDDVKEENLKQKILDFKNKLYKFKKYAKILSLKHLLSKIVEEFCLDKINLTDIDGEKANEEIDLFIKSVPDVDAFEFVLNYSDFNLQIEGSCGGDSVKMMTIHKSKGIEFKAVFLINTANGFNMLSTQGSVLFNKQLGVGMDYFDLISRAQVSTIPISAIRMIERRKLVEEQQRVLYVALTRAVQKMFIVCSKSKDKLNKVFPARPSCFASWFEPIITSELEGKHNEIVSFETYHITELMDVPKLQEKQILLTKKSIKNIEWFEYKNAKAVEIPLKNSVSKILKNSEFISEEYENNLILNEMNSSAERGTLYHKIFQNINLKNLQNLDVQLAKILEEFDENKINLIDVKLIKNVLNDEFFNKIEQNDVVLQEKEFYAKLPASLIDSQVNSSNEFIMQGVVDLIIIKQNEIWILDYKTGKINNEKLKNYKFQLKIYSEICSKIYDKPVTKQMLCLIDEQKILEI